jgi:DUF1365 family protein
MARKTDAALYVGAVMHQRFAPRRHRLRYAMFQVLFDIDETPNLARRLRLFSHNAFNVVSFHDRDHGDGREGPLRGWVEDTLGRAGMPIDGGRILLLCMPRILGHVFNPLSIYFCHDRDGALTVILYEVNNTFGERHSYLIPVSNPAERPIRQSCAKAFHVSPFMDMTMTYDFQITRPEETLTTTVHGKDASGALLLAAAFTGARRDITDASLARALATHPLLTLKVVAAIHLEAAMLLLKGLRLRPHPPAPRDPVSVVR